MQQFSWISPKTEFKFTLCNKESFVISDFTVTFLPISCSLTCQERPKCGVLLRKKHCRNRSLGSLTSGLTRSPGPFIFWDTFEKHPLVFLKALLSPSLVVSPVRSLFPKMQELILSPEYETPLKYCCTAFFPLSLLVSSFSSFPFLLSLHFSHLRCLTQVCLLLQFLLVKIEEQ